MTSAASSADITAGHVESHVLNGALVNFGPGADVLSMKHAVDYSAIRFSSNRAKSAEDIVMFFISFFQEPVTMTRVHLMSEPYYHVQIKDPTFAARMLAKHDRYLRGIPQIQMSIRQVPVEMSYETSADPSHMQDITLVVLKDRLARLKLGPGPAAPECVVCLTEAEDPYLTPCRHRYCRVCFANQCSSVYKNDEIPIRCLGDSGKCSRIFLFPELKHILQPESFQQLLNKSLSIYLRTITTIKFCPTPNCSETYRATTDGTVLTCFKCSVPCCTTCQTASHSGITCATNRSNNQLGAVKKSQGWCEGTIKKCPRCCNLIEKVEGCDRIECQCCWAGFCWKCMELWDRGGLCRCMREKYAGGKGKM